MSERELNQYLKVVARYAAEVKATETKEQSRIALINTGILDKDGNVTKEYARVIK